MIQRIWRSLFVIGTLGLFLYIKLGNLSLRFGDGNAYIYMARAINDGLVPYKDFFLADPPVFPYFLSLVRLFVGNHLIIFQLIPLLLEIGSALLIYLYLRNKGLNWAPVAPLIYLFSFTILSTSDFLTGLQLVNFFIILAIFSYEKKWPGVSGVFWALAVLTKLYAAPALLGFLIYLYIQHDKIQLKKVIIAGFITSFMVMGPLIIISATKIINFIIIHQFNRSNGLNKIDVVFFYFKKEWLFLVLACAGSYIIRKSYLVYSAGLTILFFLFFKDIYYLYLGSLMPYLVIAMIYLLEKISSYTMPAKLTNNWLRGLIVIYAIFLISSLNDYAKNFAILGRFTNLQEIAQFVSKLPNDKKLYGSHEVAPLVALASNKELLNNYIDTNGQTFVSGANDRDFLSNALVNQGGYLIGRIMHYPDLGIYDIGTSSYFSTDIFKIHCLRIKDFPSTGNESDNQIVIYQCDKNINNNNSRL